MCPIHSFVPLDPNNSGRNFEPKVFERNAAMILQLCNNIERWIDNRSCCFTLKKNPFLFYDTNSKTSKENYNVSVCSLYLLWRSHS